MVVLMINALLWFSAICCLSAFAAMLFSMAAHRRQADRKRLFHRSSVTELAWNIVPIVILLVMAMPAVVERKSEHAVPISAFYPLR